MSNDPTNPTWCEKVALAAVRGAISGAVRAFITWALAH